MTDLTQLTLRLRLPVWRRHYPSAAFWEPWHMAVLSHGGVGHPPPPVTIMENLYHPARPRSNPASQLLLQFERRTLLGHLPASMRLERSVPLSLLSECMDVETADLHHFWGNLQGHVDKHLTAEELPHLDEAARAIRSEVRQRGLDPDRRPEFFPERVTDGLSYAALARAILFVACLRSSPLRLRLYCARSEYAPYAALSLNIDVSETFLHSHGEPGGREVVLGLNLAVADRIEGREGPIFVPVLSSAVDFATLFAPDQSLSTGLRAGGRSSSVILQ